MDLYDAIIKRRSIRRFENRSIPQEVLNTILDYAKNIEPLDEQIKVNIEVVVCNHKVFSAPYYIALFSEERPGYERNAGYIMQQIAMYLTVMGLGTCYQGFTSAVAKKDAVGRKRVVTVAFGYTQEELFRDALSASRLTQQDVCTFKEEPGTSIYKLIEAVRMAPSSMNSQPWRMVIYKNRMHLFSKKAIVGKHNSLNEINIGIAMANIVMAADNQWIDISMKKVPSIADKQYGKLKYIISVKNVVDNITK